MQLLRPDIILHKNDGQLLDAGNTTTLAHYLELLNTAGLLAGIEKYSGNLIYKRSSSTKFQVHKTALISAQSEDLFRIFESSQMNGAG